MESKFVVEKLARARVLEFNPRFTGYIFGSRVVFLFRRASNCFAIRKRVMMSLDDLIRRGACCKEKDDALDRLVERFSAS